MAVEDDPFNSALHDRFSWFLSNKINDLPLALEMALRAVELNETNCDALVNIALIYYRQANITSGDEYIDKAESRGRAKSFCCLRKAIARYHFTFNEMNIEEKKLTLDDSDRFLKLAERFFTPEIPYAAKTKKSIDKFKQLIIKRRLTLKKQMIQI